MLARPVLAFLIAPAAGPLLYAVANEFLSQGRLFSTLVMSAGISYVVTIVAGVPTYLFYRAWKLRSWHSFILGGAFLGGLLGFSLAEISSAPIWLVAAFASIGGVNALVFLGNLRVRIFNQVERTR